MSIPLRHARRPTLVDVERLSRGQAALTRGVGSRQVPHRLNEEERRLYEIAVRRGWCTVRGTAHRRHAAAAGSPLLITLRQRADALAQPLVWVSQHREPGRTVVDLSPLRLTTLRLTSEAELSDVRARCCDVARAVVAGGGGARLCGGDRLLGALLQPREPLVPPSREDLEALPIWALPRLEPLSKAKPTKRFDQNGAKQKPPAPGCLRPGPVSASRRQSAECAALAGHIGLVFRHRLELRYECSYDATEQPRQGATLEKKLAAALASMFGIGTERARGGGRA